MPTSYSDLLRLAKQATGENNNTWGDIFNTNTLELIEEAIAGIESVSVTAGNVILTTNNGTADQSRAAVLKFTGTPGTLRTVTVPSVNKVYMAHNTTGDGSSVAITTGSGNTITLVDDQVTIFYCDATEVHVLPFLNNNLDLSDLANVSTARTNLGLGDFAVKTVGTGFTDASGTISVATVVPNDIGDVKMTAVATTPASWLECNGSAVNRTTYADLFTAIGTSFGVGDGSTTFNVPDFRGRSPVGLGQGLTEEGDTTGTNRTMGDAGGYESHTLTVAEMPSHQHTDQASNAASSSGGSGTMNASGSHLTGFTGGDEAHNNMQPYLGIKFIIYAGV